MQEILATWKGLEPRRRAIAAGVAGAVFVLVLALARLAAPGPDALLFAGLEGRSAAAVLAELDTRGIAYRVSGSAIYVHAARRDELRLSLAAAGLPEAGPDGYELLDRISGFSTTSQMFDAAYWRAREGELARTILALPGVTSARVHIANPPARPFQVAVQPTASVTLTRQGGAVTPAQAAAIRHLVAAAVGGLEPQRVAVVDGLNGLVPPPEEGAAQAEPGGHAEALRLRVERLLAAHVGLGNVAVEVSVETERTAERLTERRVDPDSRVAISSETEERTESARNGPGGAVTVASNLPEGDAGAAAGQGSSQGAQTRERVNYEVSESTRELTRGPGDIRRITVAVLITGGEGATGPDLDSLRDLVEAAVGFDAARGDVVTLRALSAAPSTDFGTAASAGMLRLLALDPTAVIRILVVGGVVLLLGLFVLRPLLTGRALAGYEAASDAPGGAGGGLIAGPAAAGAAASGEGRDAGAAEDPVAELRRLVEERRDEAVEVLRDWIASDERPR